MTEREEDPVNHPAHYKAASGLECIDVIEALGLGYHLGNVLKYLWRAERKGSPVEDLMKARWYLDREIERRQRDAAQRPASEWADVAEEPADKIWTINPSGPSPLADMIGTHWEGCGWSGDKRHYACLLGDAQHLRDELEAAQADADVDAVAAFRSLEHSDGCWAHGWQHYPCLLAHRTALQAKLDDAADEYEHSHRERLNAGKALERTERERDEARTERDRLAGSLAVCGVIAREGDGTCLPEYETDAVTAVRRLRAERDDARARLDELEPLVAELVAPWVAEGTDTTMLSVNMRALVLHERRRAAKEQADGK